MVAVPDYLLPHRVRIVHPTTMVDAYGNSTLDYGPAAGRIEVDAWLQQNTRAEPRDDGRDPHEQGWLMVTNHAGIAAVDRVEWTNHPTHAPTVFEVDGPPKPTYTPAGYHHTETTLRILDG